MKTPSKNFGLIGLSVVVLSACAGAGASNTEADFLCSAQVGTPCTTMSEADQGYAASRATPIKESITDSMSAAITQASLPHTASKGTTKTASRTPQGMRDGGAPYWSGNYRVPEQLGTVWIAPYLDDGGLLHEATYVHFVVQEARWGNRGG